VERERTRISYIAARTSGHVCGFPQSRVKFANATKPDRKSGVAEGRDLQFHFRASECAVDESPPVPFLHQRKLQVSRCAVCFNYVGEALPPTLRKRMHGNRTGI
jgi:hypothetical protein